MKVMIKRKIEKYLKENREKINKYIFYYIFIIPSLKIKYFPNFQKSRFFPLSIKSFKKPTRVIFQIIINFLY